MKRVTILIVLLYISIFSLFSENQYAFESWNNEDLPGYASRGKYLTIKIAVAGPGNEIYFWWGHIGLLIEDALSGESLFYDWGVFSFDTENFYYDFAFGRLYYSCIVSPADYAISRIIKENRDMTFYTLDLPDEAKTEILLFAENNVLPENRNYMYHHFDDNCATRVRDIIDMALGGAFKEKYGEAPGRYTLREHVRRHTWFSPFWDWALSFFMGQRIDRSTTIWEEMFLPSEIALRSMEFSFFDASGKQRKLVSNVEVINRAKNRPAVAEIPPQSWKKELFLALGMALIFGIFWLRSKGIIPETGKRGLRIINSERGSRYILGSAQAVFGLFLGIMGSLLFFMAFFTNHDYTFHNINILFVNPLCLAVVPLSLIAAFSKNPAKCQKAECLLQFLWTVVFLGGLVSIILRLFPAFYQQNQPVEALVMPSAFVLSIVPGWIFKPGKRGKT